MQEKSTKTDDQGRSGGISGLGGTLDGIGVIRGRGVIKGRVVIRCREWTDDRWHKNSGGIIT